MKLNRDQVAYIASLLTDDPDIVLESLEPQPSSELWDQIHQFTLQPVEQWAQLSDTSDADMSMGIHDDPGDYPSAMGAGPQRSREYVDGFDMTVQFEIDPKLAQLLDADEQANGRFPYDELFEKNLAVLADREVAQQAPGGQVSWQITRSGNIVTFSADEFDGSRYSGV
jgi:hypothetical protein